jgi:small multidrug resistance family-3 protein
MTIAKSILLFVLAAAAEIGGAWLVWQAVREGKDWWWAGPGVIDSGHHRFKTPPVQDQGATLRSSAS